MTEDKRVFYVIDSDAGKRLDVYISSQAEDLSRSHIGNLIADGFVKVNGKEDKKRGASVRSGDSVEIIIPPLQKLSAEPEDIPVEMSTWLW
jgi:23S rRNA pseudouridine1911/1915/1917 synthase